MTTPETDSNLIGPGALIAALPAVLGFVPERSLVLAAVDHGDLGLVMRVDLGPGLSGQIDDLAATAEAAGSEAVIAVVVDAEGALCPMCNEQHRELTAMLSGALARHDIELIAAHVVDRVATGGRWHCADGCGAHGAVEDPTASPLALAAVLDGRRLYPLRRDLARVIAPVDRVRRAHLAEVIADLVEARGTVRRDDPARRRDVEDAMGAAARVAAGEELGDTELAALACALADTAVRDMLFALAVGQCAAEAEGLWTLLARTLPRPWRVEALVLLAFSAYARGDGPLAGVALEAALQCDRHHRMARLLDAALRSAMRPEQIRELASTGYRLAVRLGVRLPPRQLRLSRP